MGEEEFREFMDAVEADLDDLEDIAGAMKLFVAMETYVTEWRQRLAPVGLTRKLARLRAEASAVCGHQLCREEKAILFDMLWPEAK